MQTKVPTLNQFDILRSMQTAENKGSTCHRDGLINKNCITQEALNTQKQKQIKKGNNMIGSAKPTLDKKEISVKIILKLYAKPYEKSMGNHFPNVNC